MGIQDLGAIGEFVSSVIIIITLIVLLYEVRGAVRSLRLTTSQHLNEDFNAYRAFLMDQQVAEIWVRGLEDLRTLNVAERVQFNMVASSYVWTAWYFREVNQKEGLIDDLNSRVHVDMFKHPGFREWYDGYAQTVGGDYGEYLGRLNERARESANFRPSDVSNLLQGSVQ